MWHDFYRNIQNDRKSKRAFNIEFLNSQLMCFPVKPFASNEGSENVNKARQKYHRPIASTNDRRQKVTKTSNKLRELDKKAHRIDPRWRIILGL